jgi:glycosyltransferase involved in cell wall biosynthesis
MGLARTVKKIKVVHVTFDMRIGGAEQVIYHLVENTDPSGFDVSILCLERPIGPLGKRLKEKGYRVEALNRKPGFDLSLIKQLRRYVVENGIDVLHCHQYTPFVYGVIGSGFTGCKVIFTEHGRFYPDIKKTKRIIINPFLGFFTKNITAISSATREALVEYEGFPREKIKIVYNGIVDPAINVPQETNLKQELGIPEGARVLGTVARLDPIKNQAMMIKGLEVIRKQHPETYLVIVGDGPERKNLEEIASDMQLTPYVLFTGFKENVWDYYKIMDMFLLTSFSEGTAMTLLEAMASRLPCVVTNVGGNVEIVKDKETGIIISSDDVSELAEKVCDLFKHPLTAESYGEAARKRFEDHFTVGKMVECYQAMYNGKV